MNKRIKDIIGQNCVGEYYAGILCWRFSESQLEKFAELIVRECVTVMYDDAIERKVPPDINQTPTHYAVAVLKHFGVSESPPRLDTMVATNPHTQPPGVLTNTSEGIEPNRNQFGYPFSVDSRNKK